MPGMPQRGGQGGPRRPAGAPAKGGGAPTQAAPAWNQGEGLEGADAPIYKSDAFRISAFKVLLCSNRAAHDWCGPGAARGARPARVAGPLLI
jgi:hypothetical protein